MCIKVLGGVLAATILVLSSACGSGVTEPASQSRDDAPGEAVGDDAAGETGGDDVSFFDPGAGSGESVGSEGDDGIVVSPFRGATDFDVNPCSISNRIGLAGLIIEADTGWTIALFVDVSDAALEAGDDILFSWDFGDGELLQTDEPVVCHTYVDVGSYDVTVTVSYGDEGQSYEDPVTISGERVFIADGDLCSPPECHLLECDNGHLENPCLSDNPWPACPSEQHAEPVDGTGP